MDVLRVKELMCILRFSIYHKNVDLGDRIYRKIKSKNMDFSIKKEAMLLHKTLNSE